MILSDTLLIVAGLAAIIVCCLSWAIYRSCQRLFQQQQTRQDALEEQLQGTMKELKALALQSAQLAQQSAQLDLSALAYITGENSLCLLEPSLCTDNPNNWFPVIIQQGVTLI